MFVDLPEVVCNILNPIAIVQEYLLKQVLMHPCDAKIAHKGLAVGNTLIVIC